MKVAFIWFVKFNCLILLQRIRSQEKSIGGMLLKVIFRERLMRLEVGKAQTQAKTSLSLQNNINGLCKSLNEIHKETFANLEPKNIESQKFSFRKDERYGVCAWNISLNNCKAWKNETWKIQIKVLWEVIVWFQIQNFQNMNLQFVDEIP